MKVVLSEAELMQKKGEYTTNCYLNMQQYSYCPPEQSVAATQTPTRCSRNIKKICFFYDYISQQSVQASRHQPQAETGEYIGDEINLHELLHNMVDTGATSCRLVSQLANQAQSASRSLFAMEMIKRRFTRSF